MTSFGSYNEDKRISSKLGKSKQSPSTDSQVETNSRSCKVSQKPRDNSRSQQVTTPTSQQYSYNSVDQYQYNVNTTQQQQQQQKHNHVETAAAAINNDNALPWKTDAKNGKNFYENYSKENDRRKKEGKSYSAVELSCQRDLNKPMQPKTQGFEFYESPVDSTVLHFTGKNFNWMPNLYGFFACLP